MPNWMRVAVILLTIAGFIYIDTRFGGTWAVAWPVGLLIAVLAIEGRFYAQARRTRRRDG